MVVLFQSWISSCSAILHLVLYKTWFAWPSTPEPGGSSVAPILHLHHSDVDLGWYAPNQTAINNLASVINGTGVYGFRFDDSRTPAGVAYGVYNFCNMPHIRIDEYVRASPEYRLRYVEVIHRHHKRTPYPWNMFPEGAYPWNCDDERIFQYGVVSSENKAAAVNWQVYASSANPFATTGFRGSCQFPQLTAGGLLDSQQHGRDLYGVYHDLLHFIPDELDTTKINYRVTNNVITSQVASQIIYGMFPTSDGSPTQVFVQQATVDSLEPTYQCPAASSLYSSYGVGSKDDKWTAHLKESVSLYEKLDTVSGIDMSDDEWHNWFDHYFDNLSSRLCHSKPLPCSISNTSHCITQENADAVFRRGEYEYSYIYRDSPQSLKASVASFGVWLAELSANLKNVINGEEKVIYRHNIAHDGSMSKLLSILQVDVMVWPGMGSEVAFELFSKDTEWFIRVLWKGQVFVSSNPSLGRLDMLNVNVFFAYIDGLAGIDGINIPGLCNDT